MSFLLPVSGDKTVALTEGWRLAVTAADAVALPNQLADVEGWVPAAVPGTVAGALSSASKYDPESPLSLHDKDAWYVTTFSVDVPGAWELKFEGLATISEVYLDGKLIGSFESMFRSLALEVDLTETHELAICFRALAPVLEQKGPRARWRPQLATSQGLRLIRTTLLGHMPGWCPEIHAVGPWRPISLLKRGELRAGGLRMSADLGAEDTGVLTVDLEIDGNTESVVLRCDGLETLMVQKDYGRFHGALTIPNVTPWMPHTHGEPHLYGVSVLVDGQAFDLGCTGFRSIEVDRGPDGKGFGLVVNGKPVFCRGAVWTSADLLNLSGSEATYRPLLELARDAGMNMLRIGGTMTYETRAFFEFCDQLGILVWQDFQFANYDYPVKDEAFVATVREEAREQLGKVQGCPSLAVLCGGSEIYQQGAMMGLPENRWKGPLCEEILSAESSAARPDVPYVANSPCEGALPFSPNAGIAHYYGVGAYQRPLEDARRADVRFAAECLAFSNVPEGSLLETHLPVKPGHDPRWKSRVPRDRGAGWDFEDVRDHYLKALYKINPQDLRYSDPDRYLDLSRVVTGEVMEATFAEWRRAGSSCNGALVWTYQDLEPGAGWGILDSSGMPKPAYYALKRAFRPVNVTMTDEGTNGLCVHVINEAAAPRNLLLTLACLRDGTTPVVSGRRELNLMPLSNQQIAATDLFGAFFDTTYAYRFGPPAHDVTVARLIDSETEEILAEAFHFPQGHQEIRQLLALETKLHQEAHTGNWYLTLTAQRFARSVHLDIPGWQASDNWFHLAPGAEKVVQLNATIETTGDPKGHLRALNGNTSVQLSAG
ncbi:beta-mannosidase [Roseibium algae]|uniref:beta-mannosidase n=1 Tax=Roseibium algae TaxID=3123038 RepID=A0ABU8TS64_9HYPH